MHELTSSDRLIIEYTLVDIIVAMRSRMRDYVRVDEVDLNKLNPSDLINRARGFLDRIEEIAAGVPHEDYEFEEACADIACAVGVLLHQSDCPKTAVTPRTSMKMREKENA